MFSKLLLRSRRSCKIVCISELKRFAHRYQRNKKEIFMRPTSLELDENVNRALDEKSMKHRNHPGHYTLPTVCPPTKFELSLLNCSADVALQMLKKPAIDLYNFLFQRCFSMPDNMMEAKFYEHRRKLENEAKEIKRRDTPGLTDQELEDYIESKAFKINKTAKLRLRQDYREWEPIDYNSLAKCLTYALARFAPDFAILRRILHEIYVREPNFVPNSLFDFGSGVGSVMWAVEETWPKSIKDYFCVDTCQSMLETLNLLLCNGEPQGPCLFDTNVYRRLYLPADRNVQYDVVVSAFSLMELPSYEERLRTVATLWEKTKHFLILVENGNRYGYTTVVEARDYLLAGGHEIWRKDMENLYKTGKVDRQDIEPVLSAKNMTEREKFELLQQKFAGSDINLPTMFPVGHCYMPCPHDFGCPKLMDVLPCKFQQQYFQLRLVDFHQCQVKKEFYSYVVLKKGEPDANMPRYPRIISDIKMADRAVTCDLCTANGILADATMTKRREGNNLYRLTKSSKWSDVLPIKVGFDSVEKSHFAAASSEPPDDGNEELTDDENSDDNNNNAYSEDVEEDKLKKFVDDSFKNVKSGA